MRQQYWTHLNFFKGFEYEPTVDCAAMIADTRRKEIKEERREVEKRRQEKRRWHFWLFKIKTTLMSDEFLFQVTRHNILSARKGANLSATSALPHIIRLMLFCRNYSYPYNIAPDYGII